MTLTVEALWRIAPTCPATRAAEFHPLILAAWQEFAITTPAQQAAWLGQILVESMALTRTVENLNYRASRLMAVWPKRFPTMASALPFEHKPEKLAEHVYGGRFGNGPEGSGDGWKYRGRGLIQTTFADNYAACGAALGLPLLEQPELLEGFSAATRSAAWFWTAHRLNAIVDAGENVGDAVWTLADSRNLAIQAITKVVNGGRVGLAERMAYTAAARRELDA